MNTRYFKYLLPVFALALTMNLTSCLGDLDVMPIDPNMDVTFNQDANFAKIYSGLAITGNQGPAGSADVADTDEGASGLMRTLFNINELSSDEAICAWEGDVDVFPLNYSTFTPSNGVIGLLFSRLYIQIAQINNFLIQTKDLTDEKTALQRAEVRFIRALDYYYLVDLYGYVPFVDENTGIGNYIPKRIVRADLFNYIESELKAIEPLLKAPKANLYGRVDQAGVWMLLSRLYLNSEIYTGTARWNEAATYSKKVMDAGFQLEANYPDMFKADNHTSKEMIFPICYDGIKTKSWSGAFFISSFLSGDMNPLANFGTVEAWGGNRARMALVNKFVTNGDLTQTTDQRAMFYTTDRTFAIVKPSEYKHGYSITKFSNKTKAGGIGSDPNKQFPDMDFPLFRLAEANLTYAEAVIRGGGDKAAALTAVNALRTRAKATVITSNDLTLDFILDEKSREFYFEAQRRTDLIRFKKYTSGYTWDWKNGAAAGRDLPSHMTLLPIPSNALTTNSNLVQNPKY